MPALLIMHIHCKACNARRAYIDHNTRRHAHGGMILDPIDVENVTVQNNIVYCRRCNRELGIKHIESGDLYFFGRFLSMDAFIRTRF